jgi:hypothetical protein
MPWVAIRVFLPASEIGDTELVGRRQRVFGLLHIDAAYPIATVDEEWSSGDGR